MLTMNPMAKGRGCAPRPQMQHPIMEAPAARVVGSKSRTPVALRGDTSTEEGDRPFMGMWP